MVVQIKAPRDHHIFCFSNDQRGQRLQGNMSTSESQKVLFTSPVMTGWIAQRNLIIDRVSKLFLALRKNIPQGFPSHPPWTWTALITIHFSQASGKRSVAKEDRWVFVVTSFHLCDSGLSPKFIGQFSLFLTNEQTEFLLWRGEWRETAVTLTGLGETERGEEREPLLRQNSSNEINLTHLKYSVFTGEKVSHTISLAQVNELTHPHSLVEKPAGVSSAQL